LTDDSATEILTGVYFIDLRKKTSPKERIEYGNSFLIRLGDEMEEKEDVNLIFKIISNFVNQIKE